MTPYEKMMKEENFINNHIERGEHLTGISHKEHDPDKYTNYPQEKPEGDIRVQSSEEDVDE